jgi:hypothetical protein
MVFKKTKVREKGDRGKKIIRNQSKKEKDSSITKRSTNVKNEKKKENV